MNAQKLLVSLIPWAVFSLVLGRRGDAAAGRAAVLALVLAIVFAVKNRSAGVKIIEVTGIVTFTALAVLALVGSSSLTHDVAHYGRGASAGVLALVMLGATLATPFTLPYARETVPRAAWAEPAFLAANRRISAAWGAAVLIMAIGHLVSGQLAASSGGESRRVNLLLNWGIPLLVILGAVVYTGRAAQAARASGASGSSTTQA